MLEGKKGLIIGLANDQSIAFAIAKLAIELGAEVIASCQSEKAMRFVGPHTEPLGIELHCCDVQEPEQLQQLVDRTAARFGSIDFVVHSLAFALQNDLHGPVNETSAEGFKLAMDISCHSFARLANSLKPHMPNGGTLVTLTYIGSQRAVPNYGLMGPVKAALESTVRYLAAELGPDNIRVHAVSPGPMKTRAASGIANFDQLINIAADKVPLKRLATQQEVAGLSCFLCSNFATGMTGQTLFVDAGEHLSY